jgi:hypothetical protein
MNILAPEIASLYSGCKGKISAFLEIACNDCRYEDQFPKQNCIGSIFTRPEAQIRNVNFLKNWPILIEF